MRNNLTRPLRRHLCREHAHGFRRGDGSQRPGAGPVECLKHRSKDVLQVEIDPRGMVLEVVGRVQIHTREVSQHVVATLLEPHGVSVLHHCMEHCWNCGSPNVDESFGSDPAHLKLAVPESFDEAIDGTAIANVPQAHCNLEANSTAFVLQCLNQRRNGSRAMGNKRPTSAFPRDTIPVAELRHHAIEGRRACHRLGLVRTPLAKQVRQYAHMLFTAVPLHWDRRFDSDYRGQLRSCPQAM